MAGEVELKSQAVVDHRQRRGIGRALVERAVAELRADGARTLLVATATSDIGKPALLSTPGLSDALHRARRLHNLRQYPEGLTVDGIRYAIACG